VPEITPRTQTLRIVPYGISAFALWSKYLEQPRLGWCLQRAPALNMAHRN
jgi:hypothetical protein